MKKTLTILAVLLVAAFAVFAGEEGNSITLNSTVAPAKDYLFTLAETNAPTSGKYVITTSGTASFEVTSDNVVNFGTNPAAIDIAITVSDWYGTALHEGNAITIGTTVAGTTLPEGTTVAVDTAKFTVDFDSNYNEAFTVGTFSVSWGAESTLAADSYTATVTIAYTQV